MAGPAREGVPKALLDRALPDLPIRGLRIEDCPKLEVGSFLVLLISVTRAGNTNVKVDLSEQTQDRRVDQYVRVAPVSHSGAIRV
jgi:hypothetical protein